MFIDRVSRGALHACFVSAESEYLHPANMRSARRSSVNVIFVCSVCCFCVLIFQHVYVCSVQLAG